jgi:hypothetical protein
MIDVNELLEEAIRETENLNDGEVFLVKDLFKGYVWNRIPRKDRLLLGTLFLNHVSKIHCSNHHTPLRLAFLHDNLYQSELCPF